MEKWQNEAHSRKPAWIRKCSVFLAAVYSREERQWIPTQMLTPSSDWSHRVVAAFSENVEKERRATLIQSDYSHLSERGLARPGWEVRVTRLLEQDGKGTEGRRWVCPVARIRGGRQERIWFIMASLTVSLFLLVSSFLSSLSLSTNSLHPLASFLSSASLWIY